MNIMCAKRKDTMQDDMEHEILRPETLMVYNSINRLIIYIAAYIKLKQDCVAVMINTVDNAAILLVLRLRLPDHDQYGFRIGWENNDERNLKHNKQFIFAF